MLRRLGYLMAAGAAILAGAAVILRYFSDILPLASTEPASIWRFEVAFLSAPWIALALVALAAISAVVLLWRAVRARAR